MTDTKEELLKQKVDIEEKLKKLGEKSGYEIKNRFTDEVLYIAKSDNVKEAVEEAVKEGANLWGANLREADLWGANLREANLRGAILQEADLRGTKFYGKGGTQKLKKNQVEDFLKALGFEVED